MIKLSHNMIQAEIALGRADIPENMGTLIMNAKGATFPALQALVLRNLAEIVGNGEILTNWKGHKYERTVYRLTEAGRQDLAERTGN